MNPSVTQRAVAREAGVSKYTVSVALRGSNKIPEETRNRVLKAAEKLGYHFDPLNPQIMNGLSTRLNERLAMALPHENVELGGRK